MFDVSDERPDYEAPLIAAIRTEVVTGDSVIVIGGGLGVSSVVAAEHAGVAGTVTTYEGSATAADQISETLALNQVPDRVVTEHAIVGEIVEISGDVGEAPVVAPEELPESDVLVMDCEGAELSILRNHDPQASTIIVETHGFLDAPEQAVRDLLEQHDYSIDARGIEDDENGVVVLTAHRK